MDTMKRRGVILSATLFALYIFVFLLTEFTVNVRCQRVLGVGSVVSVYSVGIICTSLGYAAFYFSRRLVRNEGKRRLFIAVLAVLFMGLTLCFMSVSAPVPFVASALLALLLFGYIGGFTHYVVALFLFGKGCTGKVVGAAVAVATVLQFIVQNLLITDAALIVSLLCSMTAILYLALKPVKDWMFENPLPYASKPSVTGKSLLLPICVVAVMSMSFGLGDGLVTWLHASGTVNLASYTRLLYALGVFAAGVVADIQERRYLPLCTLCMLVLTSAMALFIADGDATASALYISVMYLFSGFYVMYLTVTFLDTAPMTERPSLWAGMGRIVRGPFIALTATVSGPLFASIEQQGIAIAGVCLSLLALILLVSGGALNVRPEKKEAEPSRMTEFVATYQFTPREAEIFTLLLDNDATNKDIAGELLLSVRVLERYITSIYEKVGVDSRIELMNRYYGKVPAAEIATPPTPSPLPDEKPPAPRIRPIPSEKAAAVALRYGLTKRESELLEQVYLRKTNEDIAKDLGISENTVKFHLKNLMKKMSVSSRAEMRDTLDQV